ncbi:MAG: trypsin-like peptidase domain-containing protein [Gammaproteobacteria bacterium]|nr:trypsin-like peptidase domain-containing protein [Gammaproteobacteria bacterium]
MRLTWAAAGLTLLCLSAQAQDNEAAWRKTLEEIRPSVVSLRVNKTRPFDTESNTLLDGTGFVVDAGRGIILTNRHIVSTGPVKGEALFANQEEIELERLYADPVHDFGFFRYDPAGLRHIRPEGLELAPEAAQLGREIRVVGNDAGERFSILAGTIARLDRTAPNYGFGRYNDFNTFYIQAASGTSGGSSGSPVIDIEGRAVALNAGGQVRAQSSYFLPLERVRRALALVQEGKPVPRGGLLTTFEQLPYDELRRLGLGQEAEADARAAFPESAGLLVVRSTLQGSAASSALIPGDILLRIEDQEFPDFLRLEAVLDGSVGQPVTLLIERRGLVMEAVIEVSDLHAVTPREYVAFGGTFLHPTSYQQARHFNVPLNTIYVAQPGYMLGLAAIENGSILREINGRPLETLDDVEQALSVLGHEDVAQLRYSTPRNPRANQVRSARTGRGWFAAERCRQGESSQDWACRPLAPAAPVGPAEPRMTQPREFDDSRLRRIAPSLVHVRFDMPYVVSAVNGQHYYGAGLIVDTERGWVVVDRNTVPETMGDAVLTFNGTLEVTARVAAIHPVHNLAVLQYDPALLGDTPLRAAVFAPRAPRAGEEIFLAGFRPDLEPVIRSYEAGDLKPINVMPSNFGGFREANLEILEVENADVQISGVLLDSRARVAALWSSFASGSRNRPNEIVAGLPIEHVQVMLDHLRRDASWRSLEVEWQRAPLSVALRRGLPEDWRLKVEEHDRERRQVLMAERTVAGTPAADQVRPGDLLLTINGRMATRPREVEQAVAGAQRAKLLVWRNGEELELDFDTVELGWQGLQEVLFWAGALIQDPQRGMAAQLAIRPQGVTIQHYTYGSPAHRYLLPIRYLQVTALDGHPVASLGEFAGALQLAADKPIVRVEGITPTGATKVATVKLDPAYWPSSRMRLSDGGWQRLNLGE